MNLQHLNIKIPVLNQGSVEPELFNPVFQTWIQQKLCEELLIDVADYLHVPEGPGMVLVGLEADYAMDNTDGVWGLRYNRKKPIEGDAEENFTQALKASLQACERLCEAPELNGLDFNFAKMEIFLNDRGLSPNTKENAKALEAELQKLFSKCLGQIPKTYKPENDPRKRLGAHLTFEPALDAKKILSKLK